MASVNSRDSVEESYSMYPKTSSSPLPSQGNAHFPAYQPPVPIYAYPQVPYMYAGQTPAYPFNMINQNQMLYQSTGAGSIPQQNSGVATKKKWNNNVNPANTTGNAIPSSKMPHYHHHQSSPSYHPGSMNSSGSTVNPSTSKMGTLPSRADQYKFYSPKSDSPTIAAELPLFFNTTKEDYAAARYKRYLLRMKSLGSSDEQKDEKTEDGNEALLDISQKDLDSVDKTVEDTPESSKASTPIPQATPSFQDSTIPTPVPSPLSSTPKPAPKSWSAVASNALSKTKHTSGSTTVKPSSCIPAPNQSQSQTLPPQRKENKYVPASTKGVEPLGSVALRMCYDPDFIDYTLTNLASEGNLSLRSIVPRGIVNRANICFLSSVLQVLLYCQPFVDILNVVGTRNSGAKGSPAESKLLDACVDIYKKFDRETFEAEGKVNQKGKMSQLQSDIKQKLPIIASTADAINPDEFYSTLAAIPKFKDLKWGHQEDAEEFLTHLLDQLHEEFISSIDSLAGNEVQNLLQSINDEELKIFLVRNLSRYNKAEFIRNASSELKYLMDKYDTITENNEEDGNGWHEVSGSSKKGKKTKSAAKRTVEMEPTPISCLFSGQFRSVLDIPNNKESQSITLDPFQTIQLDISDKSINDLETAFKKFSEFEFLPFKSSSGSDVEAKKQTFIDRLPQVLLIQLKRFQFINNTDKNNSMVNYNAYNGRIEKIRKKIKYEHELVIPMESISSASLQSVEERKYTLTGVIYHHGLSSDGGHYTADVYHKEVDKWYRIDDVCIIELEKADVLKGGEEGADSRTAYILMYQKS